MRNIHFPSELYIWKRLSVKLCNCTKFHYSYKKVGHGVVSYTIFMFIPKNGLRENALRMRSEHLSRWFYI